MQDPSAKSRFTRLAAEHMTPLYRYAYWLARDRAAAEDLVQESLSRAWSAFGSLKDEVAGKAWLFAILRREFLRKPALKRDAEHVPLEDDALETAAEQGDAASVMDLRRAIAALPIEYREALMLQAVDGYSLEEAGRLLGIPANTVATRVHRARLKLRETLSRGAPVVVVLGGRS
jgi:RNA polymerase sigma-70 factor (ECF subfamily)